MTIQIQEKLSTRNSSTKQNGQFVFRAETAKDLCDWALALSQISSLCNFVCYKSAADAAKLLDPSGGPKRKSESKKSQPTAQKNAKHDELQRVRAFTQAVVESAQDRARAERATTDRGADFLEHKNISLISRGNVTRDHHTIDTSLDDDNTFNISLNKSGGNGALEEFPPEDILERGPPPMLPPRRAEWKQMTTTIGAPVLSSPESDQKNQTAKQDRQAQSIYSEFRDEDKAIVEYSATPCEEVILYFWNFCLLSTSRDDVFSRPSAFCLIRLIVCFKCSKATVLYPLLDLKQLLQKDGL